MYLTDDPFQQGLSESQNVGPEMAIEWPGQSTTVQQAVCYPLDAQQARWGVLAEAV
jgi:hypothetical protein